jgi:methyl-accepting chemotaxis protein
VPDFDEKTLAMLNLDDMKLGTKSLIPIGLMGLIIVAITALSAQQLSDLTARYAFTVEHSDAAALKLSRANRVVTEIGYAAHVIIDYDGDNSLSKRAVKTFETAVSRADTLFDEAAQLIPERAKQINAFRERARSIADATKPTVSLGLATPGLDHGASLKPNELNEMAKAVKLMDVVDNNIASLENDISDFNNTLSLDDDHISEELKHKSAQTVWTLIVIGALALVGGVVVSVWLSRSKIAGPISILSDQMTDISGGNVRLEVSGVKRGDEIGGMARALNVFKENAVAKIRRDAEMDEERRQSQDAHRKAEEEAIRKEREMVSASIGAGLAKLAAKDLTFRMTDDLPEAYRQLQQDFNAALGQLEAAMGNISEGARTIIATTQEISGAADDLSKRTEQQAAALEETTAALKEVTATVRNAADGAAHGAAIVGATKTEAEQSGGVVGQAVEAMGRIEKSSQEIAQIIGVIDEIAFQTNLLALNAGVEAARAGESGKGFAVVASEVRALAQRSAEAAKEIKSLISASSSQVVQGVQLVDQTGKALARIVVQFEEINRVVGNIANGAKDQATSLTEVNAALGQMDVNTQKNAAMVEETTAATHSLRREIEALEQKVDEFNIDSVPGGRSSRMAPAHRPSPVTRSALKSVANGSGSAVRKLASQTDQDSWTEF